MAAVGDLVANLMLDTKQFSRGLQKGRKGFASLKRAGAQAIGAIGSAVASGARDAWVQQARAVKLLENNLKATGGAAGLTSEQIQKFASQRQSMTNFGDEATIAGASILATFKEIKGPIFLEALSTAQDMSEAFGTDLKGSMIQLGKALNNPIQGMAALADVGVSFTESQKAQIKSMQEAGDLAGAQKVILGELAGEVGGAAEALRSPWVGVTNAFGDFQEEIWDLIEGGGGGLLDWVTSLINQMIEGVQIVNGWKQSFTESFAASAQAGTGFFSVLMKGFEGVKLGFDFLLFAASNWELTFPMIGEAAGNAFRYIVARGVWFGGAFMDVAGWVSRNWRDLFVDVGSFLVTVIGNAFSNVRQIAGEAWDWIWSGGSDAFEVNLKSLTEGFSSTVQEELKVRDFVAPVTNSEAKRAFGDAFVEYREMAADLGETEPITAADVGATSGDGSGGSGGTSGPADVLEGLKIGSAEALKAALGASSTGGLQPNEETAANTKRSNELLGVVVTKLDKMGRNAQSKIKLARRP